jgi:hypothetical protein
MSGVSSPALKINVWTAAALQLWLAFYILRPF